MRSERAFCEELKYNLLFRWFLNMNLMERSFAPTVYEPEGPQAGGGGLRVDEAVGRVWRNRYRGVERTGLAGYFVATATTWFGWLTCCRVKLFSRCDLSRAQCAQNGYHIPNRPQGPQTALSPHRETATGHSPAYVELPNPFFCGLLDSSRRDGRQRDLIKISGRVSTVTKMDASPT